MKKRNLLLLSAAFLASALVVSASGASVSASPAARSSVAHVLRALDSSSWKATGGSYSIDGDNIVLSSNTTKNSNFFITDQYDTYGDYSVTVSAYGTRGFPMEAETDIGVVPWYVDGNNYILVYLNWSNSDRPTQLREIQITGRVGGKQLVVKNNGSWVQKEWNDTWTDGQTLKESSSNTIKVTKTRSATKDSDIFSVSVNDSITATLEVRDTVQYDNVKPKVGVYGYNDTITFSGFSFQSNVAASQLKKIGDGLGKSANGSLALNDGVYSLDSKDSTSLFDNMAVLANANSSGGYEIDASFDVTEEGDAGSVALVPYYENEYSYLALGIKKEGGKYYAFAKGRRVTLMSAALTFEDIDDSKEISDVTSLAAVKSLKVSKADGTFTLTLNGTAKVLSYTNAYFVQGDNSFPNKMYGFAANGVKASISGLASIAAYNEYSFLEKNFGGKSVFVSARTDDSVSYADGTYTFSEGAVTLNDSVKQAGAYWASGKYGNVNISASFGGLSAPSTYGLYACLFDINNYVKAYIDSNAKKLIVENVVDGVAATSETALPETYDATAATHTIATALKNKKLAVTLDEAEILTDKEVSMDLHNQAKVGVLGGATSFTVTDVKVSGFTALDPIDEGDFTFFGQRVDSWNYDQENGVISNKLIEGIDNGWKATNALYKNTEAKDVYIGAKIKVNERTGSEWKVGVMPYYKDADNHVIVWFSQWSDGGCKIVVTARLNGSVIGSEWRESGDIGVNMLEDNYLEASIIGDKVSVYLNKNFTPIFETTVDGLGSRDMEMAFTGFQSGNGMAATYSEFNMVSTKRVYGFTEKPVISETGTRKTEGTVGTAISLPIYTAENSAGDFLTPVVKVTDRSGNDVTVSKNRFTPSIAGTYHVKVTCVDAWGNEADPLEYDIVVSSGYSDSEETTSEPTSEATSETAGGQTSENTDNATKGGCGGSITATTGALAAVAIAGAVLAIKKKKEK